MNRATLADLLLIVSLVLLVVFAVIASGWVAASRPLAWLGWGLAFFVASFVVGIEPRWRGPGRPV